MAAMRTRRLSLVSVLVRDYDEAIGFYTAKLGFTLVEDTLLGDGKRWVVVAPQHQGSAALLLARAANAAQEAAIGRQAGGRVFLFLETDDFTRDHRAMLEKGVVFQEQPRHEAYGTVAVFEDLYGNPWDLIERR
jgi:catechol 2,3-dioxygenase-like lactoylglutathione lyase family enzyme